MKMLTIQFGQCGNQLGYDLFSKVAADLWCPNIGVSHGANYEYAAGAIEKWYDDGDDRVTKNSRCYARAIIVDAEEKVVNKIRKDTSASWTYRPSNIVCQRDGGCGNNWAYGYNVSSERLLNAVLNVVQRQIEKLDRFQGFLLLLGSAGGTGSGVGSRIVERLRDTYETKLIVATIVLPFTFGEVCTQNYNTILTLAKFCDKADISVLFENERVYTTCTSLLKNPNVAFHDMNNIIAENLLGVFQPTNDQRCDTNFLLSNIAAHSSFRFVRIESTPYVPVTSLQYEPVHKWNVYIRHLKHTLRISKLQMELTNARLKQPLSTLSNATSYVYSPCVSNILVTRGKFAENDAVTIDDLWKRHLYPKWITLDPFIHLHQERRILNRNKFLTLVTNNSEIHWPLDIYLDKAWHSYKYAAFLHQYKQFGWEEDDFLQAFVKVENVVREYKNLKSHNII